MQHTLAAEQRERLAEVDAGAAGRGRNELDLRARGAPLVDPRPAARRSIVTTIVGASSVSNSGPEAGTRPRASRRTRKGAARGAGATSRTVSCGWSASAVPEPTTMRLAVGAQLVRVGARALPT